MAIIVLSINEEGDIVSVRREEPASARDDLIQSAQNVFRNIKPPSALARETDTDIALAFILRSNKLSEEEKRVASILVITRTIADRVEIRDSPPPILLEADHGKRVQLASLIPICGG